MRLVPRRRWRFCQRFKTFDRTTRKSPICHSSSLVSYTGLHIDTSEFFVAVCVEEEDKECFEGDCRLRAVVSFFIFYIISKDCLIQHYRSMPLTISFSFQLPPPSPQTDYEPSLWWFEVFGCFRRLFLTGLLVFFNAGSALQVKTVYPCRQPIYPYLHGNARRRLLGLGKWKMRRQDYPLCMYIHTYNKNKSIHISTF